MATTKKTRPYKQKAKIAAKKQAILKQQVDAAKEDLWGDKKAREAGRANFTEQSASKQGSSPTAQNNASANNSGNPSSNQANAKTNTGNQTTANQPQSNNVSNNANQPNNNAKGKASTGSKPAVSKVRRVLNNIWNTKSITIPILTEIALEKLNSTSPTKNTILPQKPLWEEIKDRDDNYGLMANTVDAILSPTTSRLWNKGIDKASNTMFDVWHNAFPSADETTRTNIGNIAGRAVTEGMLNTLRYGLDYIPYAWRPTRNLKLARDAMVATLNNTYDAPRDFDDIHDYSYGDLGFDEYIGDSYVRGAESGLSNLFSIFGKDRDYYQRGRYSLNEMLSTMAKDIQNFKDKNSPEYKEKVAKFEKFNNLAKLSDFYWTTKKEMDASDLSKEDFLKSKNIAPETFDYSEQNAHTVHNLGNNLALNESSGNKRSDYVAGNHKYQDFTDAVNEAKRSLEGDSTDIDTDTLNAFMDMSTDVGKAIVNKPVDTPTGTGTGINNTAIDTATENSQSSITPDYLTEFYKKFDKKYNYDPAKGRFNIWL